MTTAVVQCGVLRTESAVLHLLFHGVVRHPGAHDVPNDVPRRIRLHTQWIGVGARHPVACGQIAGGATQQQFMDKSDGRVSWPAGLLIVTAHSKLLQACVQALRQVVLLPDRQTAA